jgi:hypothetical protein
MKGFNLFLLILLFFSTVLFFFTPQTSEAQLNANDIVFYSNKTLVAPNGSITFFIGLRSGSSWQSGSITLKDITTDTDKTYNLNSELITITDFLLNSPEGIHIVEVTDGSVIETLKLVVRDPANQGSIDVEFGDITLGNPSPNVGESVDFSVNFRVPAYDFLPFDGTENLYVKTNGLINSPVIATYWFPFGPTSTSDVSVNISVFIPLWHPIGLYDFQIGFSGDTNMEHISTTLSVFLTADTFVLNIYPESTDIDRSSLTTTNKLVIDLSLGGADISLSNLYYNISLLTKNNSFNLKDAFLIGSRQRSVIVDIPYLIDLGDGYLNVDILDGTNTIFFSNQTAVVIYDTVTMALSPDSPQVRAGEIINFLALTSLTDRPNTPIEASIIVRNTTHLLGSGNTTNGEWFFDYVVPNYVVLGAYTMIWELNPLNVNTTLIRYQSITKQYTVSIPTDFQVSNFPSQIFRLEQLDFNVQLLSLDFPLIGDAGEFELLQSSDLSVVDTFFANQSNNIQLFVDPDLPKGAYDLDLLYNGNGVYEPSNKDLSIKILSQPFFTNILTNASGGVVGESIKISGYLVEEDRSNSPVFGVEIDVLVSDGVSQWVDGTATTDVTGSFSYNLDITSGLSVGVHFVRLSFSGDPLNNYGAASNEPIVNFDKDNVLELEIPDKIQVGSPFDFSVSGKLNGKYQLQYLDTEELSWIAIVNVSLDHQGYFEGKTFPPEVKGPTFFRIYDLLGNQSFVIQERIIFMNPLIQINIDEKLYSKEDVAFYFYSDQLYVVYLNDLRITPSGQLWFQEEYYEYMFNHPGNYTLRVELIGEYLTFSNMTTDFTVYEQYEIIRSSPDTITEGSSVTVHIQIRGKAIGLIQNVLVQIYNTNTKLVIAEGLTQVNGNITLVAPIFGNENELVILVPSQSIGDYELDQSSIPLAFKIRRKLDIAFDQEYELTLNEKNSINFFVTYSSTNNPATNIPFLVSIYQVDTLISNFSISTSSEGILDIPLGTLSEGSYQIYIEPADTNYAPFVIVTSVVISSTDVFNDVSTISVVLIGAIILVGVGVVTRLRA